MTSSRSPAWDAWDSGDVRSVLESLRDLQVSAPVRRRDWESAQFEVLGGISALAAPLAGVPEEAVDQTRALVEIGLLVEGASAGAAVAFTGSSDQGVGSPMEARFKAVLDRSQGKREAWDLGRCARVRAAVLTEGAALRISLVLHAAEHEWKRPARALEAVDFPEMRWAIPALEDEDCNIDELPGSAAASLDQWYVLVQLLRERVRDMQVFVRGKEPSAAFTDVMDNRFGRKRARSPSPPGTARRPTAPAPAGAGGSQPLTEERREALALMAAGMHTVSEEQLQQALNGTLDPASLLKASGERALRPVIPKHAGGELSGLDLRVYPGVDRDSGERSFVLGDDGKLAWAGNTTKSRCTSLAEWERGFCTVLHKVKSDRQHRLMLYFKDWFHNKAAVFGVAPLIKFYEFFTLRMEEDDTVGFGVASYSELFSEYSREQGLRPLGKRPWSERDAQGQRGSRPRSQQQQPMQHGGGQGAKGGRKGGKGSSTSAAIVPDHKAGDAACPGRGCAQEGPAIEVETAGASGPAGDKEEDIMLTAGEQDFVPIVQDEDGRELEVKGDQLGPAWWEGLEPTTFSPVWDAAGLQVRGAVMQERATRAVACCEPPAPVLEADPDKWAVWDRGRRRLRRSERWPDIRRELAERATVSAMEKAGTAERERERYVKELRSVGAAVPLLSERAHLVAAAFCDWRDCSFLVRGAACGVGWPSRQVEGAAPFKVPNYVGEEHMEAMDAEIEKETSERRIFRAEGRLPWGVSALGMVEKVKNGKVKYRPVWDYSRPVREGVNARIDLEKDKFSTVKDAYALLRPGLWMVKVDLDSAYRSVGVASQFWPAQCFEWRGVRYMDARAPFGIRALPGIFMRYTRAIVDWMQARGLQCVGYLDDFFMVASAKEEAEERMMLLVEFISFLGFKVNSAKCEGPEQVMEFLGVSLSTSGRVCTTAISEDRMVFVRSTLQEVFLDVLGGLEAKPWFPFRAGVPESEHINYLELFTVWNCSKFASGMRYITTKDNKLSDLLSRLRLQEFHLEHRAFMRASVWMQDKDDWMLDPVEWVSLDREFGPFTLDACVAVSRAKTFCAESWRREEDARVQSFAGHQAWGNLPFSVMYGIVVNFLRCKKRQQMGTVGTFLVPVWSPREGKAPGRTWELVSWLPEALLSEQHRYEEEALARSTWGAYNTGARVFVTFCIAFVCLGCLEPLLPATDATLVWFITFSSWFVAPGTIKNYMAGIRQLHLQRGHEWRPISERFRVVATLQGVRRHWERPSKPVMPLTPQNVYDMARHVDFKSLSDLSLWAAILVGFFGLFRKDNLTAGKEEAFNSRAALVRDDVMLTADKSTVWTRVRYSKTIQCGERYHWVPLREVPGSPLCPVTALQCLMMRTADRAGDSPLFVAEKAAGRKVQVVPLTHTGLVAGIKRLTAAAGLQPEKYAGHSLHLISIVVSHHMPPLTTVTGTCLARYPRRRL
ncbi:hypothetical protein CYMTET_39439 [Cymbomonas tetramitiformis]|uniref:Reverse transcriptase domain-containing protein n=1 Tax=Cymbomonas tetramitiformis TaxID=36881 RepID=A0AAE0CA33_9CHLO|nr:hypothetical protein CYMTET_39439 [Cymbomonas tetramitiformis]